MPPTALVAQVVRKWNPLEWGGTETYVANITSALQRHQFASEVHAPVSQQDHLDPNLPEGVSICRFRAHNPYLASTSRRAALQSVGGNIISFEEPLRLLRDSRIALAHLHTAGRIGGAIRWAMQHTRRPYVLSVHGPVYSDPAVIAKDTAARKGTAIDLGAPIGALFGARKVVNDAAAVICFNDDELHALQTIVGSRAVRMDHGVDVAHFSSGQVETALELWPALRGKRCWLVPGRLSRQKNQALAMEAFARLPEKDVELIFAGAETDEGYAQTLAQLAEERGISQRVHFLGNVPKRNMPHLFRLCEGVLVPSTHEAFGLVVVEGWAARKPVLFANCVGMRDLGRALNNNEGTAVVCVNGYAPELWSALWSKLCREPSLRAQAAEDGWKLVQQRFLWSHVSEGLAKVYQSVLRGSFNAVD